ncbi:hypothetical protein L596_013049 [Steinernema carpocapsae]|uniref:Uncharacterized protein n=1 Tax=Steinernema carpocapsae TaxID=34508 RepID=A0A4U5NZW5_STECR|nr:hypothetical protein L596_013049 [Steinernema carpocapsae]
MQNERNGQPRQQCYQLLPHGTDSGTTLILSVTRTIFTVFHIKAAFRRQRAPVGHKRATFPSRGIRFGFDHCS